MITTLAAVRGRRGLLLTVLPPMLFTMIPVAGQFVPRQVEAGATPALRVMTANLLMVNQDTAGIIGEVQAARPDVLLLQEYTAEWDEAIQRCWRRTIRIAAS